MITVDETEENADERYAGLSEEIAVNYVDDDTAGFEFSFVDAPDDDFVQDVNEGRNAYYKARLTSRPTNNQPVSLAVTIQDRESGEAEFFASGRLGQPR